jgi:predicted DNA-binding transcriptional regulator
VFYFKLYILILSLSSLAFTKVHDLNELIKDARAYRQSFLKLEEGDTIILPDQPPVTVNKILGSGATATVVDIGDGKALRLPHSDKVSLAKAREWNQVYGKDGQRLKSIGVNSPEILHYNENFLIVEKIDDIQFSYNKLLRHLAEHRNSLDDMSFHGFTLEQLKVLRKAAKDFLGFESLFIFITDLHNGNLVYSKSRGWMVLDYHYTYRSPLSLLLTKKGIKKIRSRFAPQSKICQLRAEIDQNIILNQRFPNRPLSYLFNGALAAGMVGTAYKAAQFALSPEQQEHVKSIKTGISDFLEKIESRIKELEG